MAAKPQPLVRYYPHVTASRVHLPVAVSSQGFWAWVMALLLGTLGGAHLDLSAASRSPNILVLVADQWRAQAFGIESDPNARTPHFDQLARESLRMVNAVSALPVCSPTRASLLTGQRPLRHGVFVNDVPLATNAVTIAKVLSAQGYDTAYIGKWHVDGRGRSSYIPPERRQGFDYWKVLECTHDYTNSAYYGDSPQKQVWPGYDAVAQTRDACEYLRGRGTRSKPFLMFLAWGPPHDPYFTAPAAYRERFQPEQMQVRPNVPEAMRGEVRKILAGYYAHCSALDDCLAELRRTLKETGLADDTILVFTADHGDMLGSHGLFKKQKPYDESVRVPLWFHWPKGFSRGGTTLSAPMNTEDLMPTLLGLSAVPIPTSVQGIDYSAYLKGGPNPGDNAAMILCVSPFGEWERRVGGKEYRGLRTPTHTYVRDLQGPWLLFDNVADPYQTNNLIARSESRAVKEALDQRLLRKLEEQRDAFETGQAYLDRWNYRVNAFGTMPYAP